MNMTIKAVVWFAVLFLFLSVDVSAANLVKVPAPVALYTFNDTEVPYADESGNGHDLTSDDARAPTISNGIAAFNGKHAIYSELKTWDFSDRLTSFSFSVVAKADSQNRLGALISTGQSNFGGCSLLLNGSQKKLYINSTSDLPSQTVDAGAGFGGAFVRYTVTFDALRGIMYTYIDDTEVQKVLVDCLDMKSTLPFSIGATVLANDILQGFVGEIDEVAVYDVALTPNQVLRLNGIEAEETESVSDATEEESETSLVTEPSSEAKPMSESTLILIIIVVTVALLAVIYIVFVAIRMMRRDTQGTE